MKLQPTLKYRSDIDGLRAIAVLSVIIFHLNPHWLSGGFLGVDIFFVISGYLITLILTKEIDKTHTINLSHFYTRRIKRIIPALLFMLIPTFIVGFLFLAPSDLLSLSKSMIWAFFSSANIYFFSSIDTGYFASGSHELPLLHLWSLGVEEQFYILWPFVVLLLLRYVHSLKNRIVWSSILFIASLVWAQTLIVSEHSFAYYMLPTRAWELLAGAIVALLVHSGFRAKGLVNEVMGGLGILVIVLSFIFVSKSDPAPGIASLPIIIATALLILSGTVHQTIVGRILSMKILVAMGLLSYAAYLWHWPIIAYVHYQFIEIDIPMTLFVLLFSFTMATVSYFVIERPLRTNNFKNKKVFVWYFILPAIVITSISLVTTQAIQNKSSWIFPWKELTTLTAHIQPADRHQHNCQYRIFKEKAIYNEERCAYPLGTQKTDAFLIGDSNAAHYLGMVKVFAKEYGFSLQNTSLSACPIVLDNNFTWIKSIYKVGCTMYTHSILEEAKKYDNVIVGGIWSEYYEEEGFQEGFEETIKQLAQNIKYVILLAQAPIFKNYNHECEVRRIHIQNLDCATHFNHNLQDERANSFLRKIAKQYDNVEYFSIRKQLCKGISCSPYINDTPVYYNAHHLSLEGSAVIGLEMIKNNDSMLSIFKNIHVSD
ncbi:MAG: acyltransferase family protein [Sulfurovum sp.]|nr:acyltransferase family protein [Sulfurovum sp.]